MRDTSAQEYANALRHAAAVIESVGEDVFWIDDISKDGTARFAVKWRCESRAEAEELRDRMVSSFFPSRLITEQPHNWGCVRMYLPNHPAVDVEIGFRDCPKE